LQNKILFVQCYAAGKIGSNTLFRKPVEYRDHLIKTYPEMEKWAKKEIFEQIEEWPDEINMHYHGDEINVVGHFLAGNIDTYSYVIDKPVTPEILISELGKDSYTHVGFSLIINDYTNFISCTKSIKEFDPSIKIIAGGAGAMYEGTNRYVDYLCIGRGVPFLRNLFSEDVNKPYNLVIIPDHLHVKYSNNELKIDMCRIITKIGCPFNCDFCTTPAIFQGEYTGELFSPQHVHDELVKYRDNLGINKLHVYFVDPTTIFSLQWWYEFFGLFKEDYGDFSLVVYGVLSVLEKLNLDKVSKYAARIHTVNFGIESFNKNYVKTSEVNIRSLISRLSDYGIITNPNYIIGFDFDSKESIWEDIRKLTSLDADIITVLNLHPNPMTNIWEDLSSQNRLLDIPPDFYHIHGFQSYIHPHFKPGFDDMLPLLCKIYNYIETEIGIITLNAATTLENLLDHTNHPKMIKREIKTYKSICKMIFPKWKQFFNPSEIQEANYLNKLK